MAQIHCGTFLPEHGQYQHLSVAVSCPQANPFRDTQLSWRGNDNTLTDPFGLSTSEYSSVQSNVHSGRVSSLMPRELTGYRYNLVGRAYAGRNQQTKQAFTLKRWKTRHRGERDTFSQHRIMTHLDYSKQIFDLTPSDCYFLPPGGCHPWVPYLRHLDHNYFPGRNENTRVNSGCPANLLRACKSKFPVQFSKRRWLKGNFTVVMVIKIAQMVWQFREHDDFQPYFRFYVLNTLLSNIQPYDDKVMLTHALPTRCACPNEMMVGKTYLMLTHSNKGRHTLNVTRRTVFLSNYKKFAEDLERRPVFNIPAAVALWKTQSIGPRLLHGSSVVEDEVCCPAAAAGKLEMRLQLFIGCGPKCVGVV
ncbi:hypothetical protein P879_02351 [Paragonimus westermani]|uniref:Uncharacterized protein n=1 Tax=Paragonimus westermani TaxID=34504 RepID=A0A8T0DZ23_9TREM|nr:hypothetical protein P879_02351 [Paragonimus westermani]